MIIENKGSFQAKADTFFLIFMYFKEKKQHLCYILRETTDTVFAQTFAWLILGIGELGQVDMVAKTFIHNIHM